MYLMGDEQRAAEKPEPRPGREPFAPCYYGAGAEVTRRCELTYRLPDPAARTESRRVSAPPGPVPICALPEKPPGAPPERTPSETVLPGENAVNARSASGCVGRHTYIWLKSGGGFWLYPTYSGKRSLSGYRWTPKGWVFSGVILDWIDFFQCL